MPAKSEQAEALDIGKHEPQGHTCVMLITSLTNAIAFSGWNLQVPFCGERKEPVLEPVLEPTLLLQQHTKAMLEMWKYLSPVRVRVLPHEPSVIQYVLEGLAGQAPARQHGQNAD